MQENIGLCAKYFKQMAPMNLILEMEIGITGGHELECSGLQFLRY